MIGGRAIPRLAWLLAGGLAATACGSTDEAERPSGVSAELNDAIATVVTVRWSTDQPSVGFVEYGEGETFELRTPMSAAASTQHRVSLLGLAPDTEYRFRAVSVDGDRSIRGELQRIRTGPLPPGMPHLTVEGDGHQGFTLVPLLGTKTAVTIVDARGRIVWYHEDDRELDIYRVRLSVDGSSVLYNAASVSGDPADDSELVRVALDGSSTSSIPVPLLAHDFVQHADGTLAAIVVEYRDFEGTQLRGDSIVEVAPDGTTQTVWSSWDCFDPAQTPGDDPAHGWTFANALDYDPAEDAYYLGMRNFSSIAKIDRQSGACEWVLGSYGATLEFAQGSARFLHQHQFELRGDHLLVMDNDGSPGNESRVLEYELDFESGTATQVWSYVADPSVYTFVLGEPMRLDNGDTFINWSAAGQMERVSADGESIWKLNTRAGFAFGFHTLADSLYPRDDASSPATSE